MMQQILCKIRDVMNPSESATSSSHTSNNEILKMDHAIQRLNQSQSICLFRTDYLE